MNCTQLYIQFQKDWINKFSNQDRTTQMCTKEYTNLYHMAIHYSHFHVPPIIRDARPIRKVLRFILLLFTRRIQFRESTLAYKYVKHAYRNYHHLLLNTNECILMRANPTLLGACPALNSPDNL